MTTPDPSSFGSGASSVNGSNFNVKKAKKSLNLHIYRLENT